MRTIAAALLAILFSSAGPAQEDALPASVAQAYLGYERAMQAGDRIAAMAAAEAAWQAGEREDISPDLIGILAANYAELAMAEGESEAAFRAWRDAARIADREGSANVPERVQRWYMAALAAYMSGDRNEAWLSALRAVQRADNDPAAVPAPLQAQARYLLARSRLDTGHWAQAEEYAEAAVEAFEAAGTEAGLSYADAYYMLGLARFFWGERTESALPFHISSHLFAALGEERRRETQSLLYWMRLVEGGLDEAEQEAIDAQIAASRYPERLQGVIEETDPDGHFDTDTSPRRRISPDYPLSAARAGIDGIVLVRFDVDAHGRTQNAEVVAAAPAGVFDEVSIEAIEEWEYHPAIVDGTAVQRPGVLTQFRYTMCEGSVGECRRRQRETEQELLGEDNAG